jgi:hypothetical protein
MHMHLCSCLDRSRLGVACALISLVEIVFIYTAVLCCVLFFLDRSSRGIFLFLELNARCGRGQLTVGSEWLRDWIKQSRRGISSVLGNGFAASDGKGLFIKWLGKRLCGFWETALRLLGNGFAASGKRLCGFWETAFALGSFLPLFGMNRQKRNH